MRLRLVVVSSFLIYLMVPATSQGQIIRRRGRTRPKIRCAIPTQFNYQTQQRSSVVTAISNRHVFGGAIPIVATTPVPSVDADPTEVANPELNVEPTTDPTEEPQSNLDIKIFQWNQAEFKIDHCSISNVVFRIDKDGQWHINLRADQNRQDERVALNVRQPLHIKRNRFAVKIRCIGNFVSSATPNTTTGKPIFREIAVPEFWVENGQPKFVNHGDFDLQLKENYDLIDHVELEFSYYR